MDDIHHQYSMNHRHFLTPLLVLHVLRQTCVVPHHKYLMQNCSRYLTARRHVPIFRLYWLQLSDSSCMHIAFVLCSFSSDQAGLQMVFSVCLSVRPSVSLSHLFDYVPIIVSSWKFQELLPMTKVRSMETDKVRGQRSRSQRSQSNLTVSGL